MSDEELKRRQGVCYKLWHRHGSWLLLVLIGMCCYMTGYQVAQVNSVETIQMVIEAHDRQDAQRVSRIRELVDANTSLSVELGRTSGVIADKAEGAAKAATEAAVKATEAATSASANADQAP